MAIKLTPEMRKTAEFQKMAAKSESVRDYLERNAQSPFEYDWSGYVFGDLLFCLAHAKNIERELSKKDLQLMKDSLERKRKAEDRFPDAGRAFLDGLKIIHEYFKLVDDKTMHGRIEFGKGGSGSRRDL